MDLRALSKQRTAGNLDIRVIKKERLEIQCIDV